MRNFNYQIIDYIYNDYYQRLELSKENYIYTTDLK